MKYGSELKTLCTILNAEGIVALDRLTDLVSCITHGGINLSKGSIVNFTKELNQKSEYLIKEIEEDLLNSEMMNTDATTGRCENKNICVRTYSKEKTTLLILSYGKGKKNI